VTQTYSERLYLRVQRADVAFFRFSLEAQDGLALFTSLGADSEGRMTLLLRLAPGARRAVLHWLAELGKELPLTVLPIPPRPSRPLAPKPQSS
jgi:hypothetical protein